jgi:hypothetical protein
MEERGTIAPVDFFSFFNPCTSSDFFEWLSKESKNKLFLKHSIGECGLCSGDDFDERTFAWFPFEILIRFYLQGVPV